MMNHQRAMVTTNPNLHYRDDELSKGNGCDQTPIYTTEIVNYQRAMFMTISVLRYQNHGFLKGNNYNNSGATTSITLKKKKKDGQDHRKLML